MPGLNSTIIKNLEFILPSIKIQMKILQKIDSILEQLEEKKKTIFSIIEQNKKKITFFEKNWLSYIIDKEIQKHPQSNEWPHTTLIELSQEGNDKFYIFSK